MLVILRGRLLPAQSCFDCFRHATAMPGATVFPISRNQFNQFRPATQSAIDVCACAL